jgi:hypothetical protein
MVANRLATTGKQWTKFFARRNSGTYNNQWMILDYNRFEPGMDASDTRGLLWVLEQLPGRAARWFILRQKSQFGIILEGLEGKMLVFFTAVW